MSESEEPAARASGITLHLTPEPVWAAQEAAASYLPERFADEGFVHCTNGEREVLDVGNRYYRGDPRPFLLLDVDLARVGADAIYEDDACLYPHIYGPIDRGAVRRVRRVRRGEDGAFQAIGEPTDVPASARRSFSS